MKTIYRLKQKEAAFQITEEGPFAYHTFRHGEGYADVPAVYRVRFDAEMIGVEGPVQPVKKGGRE